MRTALILLLAAAGCVSASRYAALEKQLDRTRTALRDQTRDKDHRILRCDGDLLTLRVRRQEVDRELRESEMGRARLEAKLATVVRDRAALTATAQELMGALAESNRRKVEADLRVGEYQLVLARFWSMIGAGKLQVKVVDGRMVLALPSDVLFRSGSAELSPAGQQAIAEVTGGLLSIPEHRFQVEGHTDNVPIRSARFSSNWELGAARAISIVRTMVAVGLDRDRVSAASFSDTRPVAGNDTEEGRSANRRIEIVVVPDLSLLPGYDELMRAVDTW